ncbi:MAG: uracil-DNA glycosylase [Candidatus Paceibacterota bacterium]|jgi:DNA polymerase
MNKSEMIAGVKKKIDNLKKSPLYNYRKENNYIPVIGEGSLDAHIMFVGEAPGKNEAATGKPFCGRSGKLLDEMLLSIGLSRLDIYITNLVNDRPHDNRDPNKEEIILYSPFLDEQIKIIKPKVIVMLGRLSMNYLFERAGVKEKLQMIGQMHGKMFEGEIDGLKVKLLPLYHPAAAIYNQKLRGTLFEDFKNLKGL